MLMKSRFGRNRKQEINKEHPPTPIMKKQQIIGLIGIGIFACLTFQATLYIFYEGFERALLNFQINPFLIYGASKYGSLAITLLLFFLFTKKIIKYNFEDLLIVKKGFIFFILSYIFTQVLQFVLEIVISNFRSPEYKLAMESYADSISRSTIITEGLVNLPVWTIQYIFFALIIFRGIISSPKKN